MTLVVKISLYLQFIRFLYFVVKQVKISLSSASSSFLTVCTDGIDIVETAEKGVKVFDTGQFDFLSVANFEFSN